MNITEEQQPHRGPAGPLKPDVNVSKVLVDVFLILCPRDGRGCAMQAQPIFKRITADRESRAFGFAFLMCGVRRT